MYAVPQLYRCTQLHSFCTPPHLKSHRTTEREIPGTNTLSNSANRWIAMMMMRQNHICLWKQKYTLESFETLDPPQFKRATHLGELDSILIGGLEAALHHGVAPWAWGQLCSTASPSSLSPAVPSLSCHVVCCPAGRRPRTCWWKLSPAFLPCHQFSPATCLPPALCHFPRSSFMWFTLNLSYVEFLLILSFFSQALLFASQSLSCTPQTKLPDKDSLPRTDAFLFRRRILSPPVVLKLCCKWLLWFCKALFWIFLKALRGMRTKLSSSCFCLGCRNLQEQIYSTIYHETEPVYISMLAMIDNSTNN